MHPRTGERRHALDVLYSADLLGDLEAGIAAAIALEDVPDGTRALLTAAGAHSGEIDRIIRRCADRWTLERMPVVDRNVLRLGIAELLYLRWAPDAVVINEMVELVRLLSTEDSGRFVNGILGRVARERRDEESGPGAE